jgi:hypothetical protein
VPGGRRLHLVRGGRADDGAPADPARAARAANAAPAPAALLGHSRRSLKPGVPAPRPAASSAAGRRPPARAGT